MGIYSCIGKNLQEVKESLYNGKSGIVCDAKRKEFGYRSCLTGMVEEPNLKQQLSRRERISLGEEGAYGYTATIEALKKCKNRPTISRRKRSGNPLWKRQYRKVGHRIRG
jgi:3-oxoacyl-[acyl-carrier-protein] synthase-1